MTQASPHPSAAQAPTASDDVVIKAMGLTKLFKDFWLRDKVRAVDNIDLEVNRSEVFGLLGPNGSGKSTTIKMILGLLHPTAGRISVFGKLPRDVATKKIIGYLPEETYLYKFLNPIETLDYYGKLFHLNAATRKNRIEMLLEMVGLEHAARRPVGEFSKGMMRKIGLAQALINDPQLLILDEPTSGMDPIATNDVKQVIRKLADRGKTVLLCSHMLADVQDVCDRAAMMYGGKVRELGTMDELLEEQDKTIITTSMLDGRTDEQVIAALEALGLTDAKLDRPRRTLEQAFLEMVHKAQREGIETYGARSGRDVADFLKDGSDDQTLRTDVQEREVVIDSLVNVEPERPKPAKDASNGADRDAVPAPIDEVDSVIAGLTDETPAPPPPPKAPTTPAKQTPADPPTGDASPSDQADDSVIDDLLNG